MQVCFLANNTRSDNGWGRAARELLLALARRGVELRVLTEEGGGLTGERVKLSRSQRHLFFVFLSVLRSLPELRQADLIHAFDGYPYSLIGALAGALLGKRLLITLHGTYALYPFYSRTLSRLYRWALRRADRVVAVSEFTLRTVSAFQAMERAEVIPNGTSSLWLGAPRSSAPPPVPRPYLLSVGMVKPQKGFAVSIRAFAGAKRRFPKLSYAIVGGQGHEHFAEITKLLNDLDLKQSVYFFEDLSDEALLALYDHAELFVLTPLRQGPFVEGFGLVYREAASRGLAAVGSRDCGAEEAIVDGRTGLLVPQGNVEAARRAIEELLADPLRRARMGEEAKRLARSWSWDRVAELYHGIYERTVAPRR